MNYQQLISIANAFSIDQKIHVTNECDRKEDSIAVHFIQMSTAMSTVNFTEWNVYCVAVLIWNVFIKLRQNIVEKSMEISK